MKHVFFIFFISFLSNILASAQDGLPTRGIRSVTDTAGFAKGLYKPFRKNNLKIAPAFFGLSPKGATLSYETGMGAWPYSFQLSAKYFSGTDSSESAFMEIRKHWRFELQTRFWGIHFMEGIFVAPLFDVYDNLDLGAGGLFGYQHFFADYLLLEMYVGVQSRNSTDNYASPIFLRYGFSLGYSFFNKQNR